MNSILKKTELVGSKAQIWTSTKAINNKQPNKCKHFINLKYINHIYYLITHYWFNNITIVSSAYNSKYKNDLKANKSSGAIKLKQSNSKLTLYKYRHFIFISK